MVCMLDAMVKLVTDIKRNKCFCILFLSTNFVIKQKNCLEKDFFYKFIIILKRGFFMYTTFKPDKIKVTYKTRPTGKKNKTACNRQSFFILILASADITSLRSMHLCNC